MDFGYDFSVAYISKTHKKLSITRKRFKNRSARTISAVVINQRKVYAREMRLYPNSRLIFLAETGYNLHSGTHYGYSFINTDAHLIVPANRGRNISLIAILSIDRISHFKLVDGAYNGSKLLEFLIESWESMNIKSNDILIMDNVRFHHSSEVQEWCLTKNSITKYFPPYSPDLNPLENVFSPIKSRYRAMRPIPTNSNMIKNYVSIVIVDMNKDSGTTF